MTSGDVVIVGCGFVADLYMRSFETFPNIRVRAVWDQDPARLQAFTAHWNLPAAASLEDLMALHGESTRPFVLLNLTNPHAHYTINKAALDAGCHVYCEKPLATDTGDAEKLVALATEKGLMLASAPCSWLGEAAQTAWAAVRAGAIGTPRLVYAELDDDFIPQAPYEKWLSESGAPWPAEDEFRVGCTLEHAGYYLTWLMAMFGPVRTVVAASAALIPDKIQGHDPRAGHQPNAPIDTPDFATGILFFESGMVARLTCSIIAKHDHRLRIFGDSGTLEMDESWNNAAKVKIRKRFRIRRRLMNSPFARLFKLDKAGDTHPKVGRWGAAAMNFALGPADLLTAQNEKRAPMIGADFSLHLTEVTLAIQNALESTGSVAIKSRFTASQPMPWAGGDRP